MKKQIGMLLLIGGLLLSGNTYAINILSVTNGNWASTNTWAGAVVPGSNDTALIDWDDQIIVDSSNKVGIVKFDGGASSVWIQSGGVLDIGEISPYLWRVEHVVKNFDQSMNVQGGKLIVNGEYRLFGGGLDGFGVATNYLNVYADSEVDLLFTEVGWWGDLQTNETATAIVNIEGDEAIFTVSQNWSMGQYGGLRWVASTNGAVSPVQSLGFEGTASVLVDGSLEVDLSAASTLPDEIVLLENGGLDPISGTFDSTNIISSSNYEVNYAGGDGNDLSLVRVIDFDAWIDGFGLSGTNALPGANPDGDKLSNLYEFGLGGNPTNSADIGYVPTTDMTEAGGTNWFVYVYARRISPNNGLTYYLEQDLDLVTSPGWIYSGDYIEVDTGILDSDFESVTNWISTEGKSTEFIKLIIE